MALSKSGLAARITSNLIAKGFLTAGSPWIEKLAAAVADAVVDEIVENSQLVAVSTDNEGGITAGTVK